MGEVQTGDLFGRFPEPADLTSPTLDLRLRIATSMARAMKRFAEARAEKRLAGDRYEVAARMSRILGRDVTKHILDAYAAASKETHVPNLAFSIAFDRATEQRELLELHAELCGCGVLVGSDNLRAEVLAIEIQEEELRKKKKALKLAITRSTR